MSNNYEDVIFKAAAEIFLIKDEKNIPIDSNIFVQRVVSDLSCIIDRLQAESVTTKDA